MSDPDALLVRDAERRLLDPVVRADPDAVDAMLDPAFREIGRSGRLWTRDAVIAALVADPSTPGDALADADTQPLAPDLILLTYTHAGVRRSSLWRLTPDGPRIVFHQGTPILGEDQ